MKSVRGTEPLGLVFFFALRGKFASKELNEGLDSGPREMALQLDLFSVSQSAFRSQLRHDSWWTSDRFSTIEMEAIL